MDVATPARRLIGTGGSRLSASQPHVPQPDSDARPTRDGITARAHRLEVLQAELETEAQRLAEARNALDDRTLALDHRDAELLKRAQTLRGQEQALAEQEAALTARATAAS
jgi:uncharacterized protein (DUF3084 family)